MQSFVFKSVDAAVPRDEKPFENRFALFVKHLEQSEILVQEETESFISQPRTVKRNAVACRISDETCPADEAKQRIGERARVEMRLDWNNGLRGRLRG